MPCLNVFPNEVTCPSTNLATTEWCESCRTQYRAIFQLKARAEARRQAERADSLEPSTRRTTR